MSVWLAVWYNYGEFLKSVFRRGEIAVRSRKTKTSKVLEAKGELLRSYEVVLIINPEIGAEELDSLLDGVSKTITGKGGAVDEVVKWGRRKLAYPINRLLEGTYVLMRFKSKPSLNRELSAGLRISEKIMRHLLVNLEAA